MARRASSRRLWLVWDCSRLEMSTPSRATMQPVARGPPGWRRSSGPRARCPFRQSPGDARLGDAVRDPALERSAQATRLRGGVPVPGCCGLEGKTLPRTKGTDELIGHDSAAVGWPWVDGTHSWLEPTALAILALCREGLAGHPRVDAGIELILNRSAREGWLELWKQDRLRPRSASPARPHGPCAPGPGRARRSVAGGGTRARIPAPGPSQPGARGLPRLGSARPPRHGACPVEADAWLAASYGRCAGRADATMGLALLLLAASDEAIRLLVKPDTDVATTRKRSEPSTQFLSRNTL